MEIEKDDFVKIALDEEVPHHILRTEDNFDSEDDDEWESDSDDHDCDDMDDDDYGEAFEEGIGDLGWADAMAKILNTKPSDGNKSVVLAKAKKITDIKPKEEDIGFEIVGEVKEEPNKPPNIMKQEVQNVLKVYKLSKKQRDMLGRLKPNVLEKNREKVLSTIATKGVVQLFNAVREQQKKLDRQLSRAGSVRKEEKIYKSVDKKGFLNMLTGSTAVESKSTKMEPKVEEKEEDPSWNVLRDDFMMGANLKDWDKEPE